MLVVAHVILIDLLARERKRVYEKRGATEIIMAKEGARNQATAQADAFHIFQCERCNKNRGVRTRGQTYAV